MPTIKGIKVIKRKEKKEKKGNNLDKSLPVMFDYFLMVWTILVVLMSCNIVSLTLFSYLNS